MDGMDLIKMCVGGLCMLLGAMEALTAMIDVCARCRGTMAETDETDVGLSILKVGVDMVTNGFPTGGVKVSRCVKCGCRDTVPAINWLGRIGGVVMVSFGFWLWP